MIIMEEKLPAIEIHLTMLRSLTILMMRTMWMVIMMELPTIEIHLRMLRRIHLKSVMKILTAAPGTLRSSMTSTKKEN